MTVNETSDDVSILLNDKLGDFSTLSHVSTGDEPWAAAVADLDGDDAPDLVVTIARDGNVVAMRNDTTGAFTLDTNCAARGDGAQVSLGGLDGDGDDDLVFLGSYDEIVVLRRRGTP